MELSIKEIAERVGISEKACGARIEHREIKPTCTIVVNGRTRRMYDESVISELIRPRVMGRPKRTVYWRVSVYDEQMLGYVVLNAGLLENQARDVLLFYENMGLTAQMLPCAQGGKWKRRNTWQ